MVATQFPARFGKYILLDRVNSGGMAEVYRAKVMGVENFERLVAIKCMLPSLLADSQFTAMFIDEAKLASQLNHANIVHIYELGKLNDRLYIAMELVNGHDLRHLIRTSSQLKKPLPISFVAYIIFKASEALDFAHRKIGNDGEPLNLVHRDVSPQNILVSYDGQVKIVDFGIAKATARTTETQTGILKGKFGYMAPEQLRGEETDRRIDIFALGICLYEGITGKRLFSGESDLAILEQIRDGKLPDFKKEIPGCPEELLQVLERALAQDVNQRYQYASELAEDLEQLLIEDRSIFGAKRAAQVMQSLYSAEILRLSEDLRRFAEVTDVRTGLTPAPYQDPRSITVALPRTGGKGPSDSQIRDMFDIDTGSDANAEIYHSRSDVIPVSPGMDSKPFIEMPTTRSIAIKLVASAVFFVALFTMTVLVAKRYYRSPAAEETSIEAPPEEPSRTAPEAPAPTTPPTPEATATPPVIAPAPEAAPPVVVEQKVAAPEAAPKYGYLSVKANNIGTAIVYVDGKEVGYSPLLFHKVRAGKHEIKIEESVDGKPGRVKNIETVVTVKNTRNKPARVAVSF